MAPPLPGAFFWNQLGTPAQILSSGLGVNGVITGNPLHSACKFDNGIYDAGNLDYATFPAAYTVGASKRIIEYWWKPDNDHNLGSNRRYIRMQNGANDTITILTYPASYSFAISAYVGGAKKSFYWYNFTYSANQLMYVYIEMDSNAGANNRIKLWIDTAFKVPWIYNADFAYAFSGPLDVITGHPGVAQPSASSIDNLKLYDETGVQADIWANKDNEGWPSVGGGRLIGGGLLRTNMIGGSVLIH